MRMSSTHKLHTETAFCHVQQYAHSTRLHAVTAFFHVQQLVHSKSHEIHEPINTSNDMISRGTTTQATAQVTTLINQKTLSKDMISHDTTTQATAQATTKYIHEPRNIMNKYDSPRHNHTSSTAPLNSTSTMQRPTTTQHFFRALHLQQPAYNYSSALHLRHLPTRA